MARSPKSSKGSTKATKADKADDSPNPDSEENAEAAATESNESAETEVSDEPALIEGEATEVVQSNQEIDTETTADTPEVRPDDVISDVAPESEASTSDESDAEASDVPGAIHPQADTSEDARAASVPVVSPAPEKKSGGALSMMFGGLLAGAIGFLIAAFALPEWAANQSTPVEPDAGLAALIEEQNNRLDALTADLQAVREAPQAETSTSDLSPLTSRLDAAEGSLARALETIGSQLADLDGRLTTLEERPVAEMAADGSGVMEAQLDDFRQQLDAVTADAEARIAEAQTRASEIETEAAAMAEAAERSAALAEIRAAIESGTPFEDELSAFADAPDALTAVAAEGVPTLSALQEQFPALARQVLSNTVSVSEEASTPDRFAAFLRRQTNARSLAPREGDSADAVLSRAEAALREGRLTDTLGELSALPEGALGIMQDWITAAERRVDAVEAVSSFEETMN